MSAVRYDPARLRHALFIFESTFQRSTKIGLVPNVRTRDELLETEAAAQERSNRDFILAPLYSLVAPIGPLWLPLY
jgi:hypothetical protein